MLACVTIAHVVEWALREEKFQKKKASIPLHLLLLTWCENGSRIFSAARTFVSVELASLFLRGVSVSS
jgi:hypothetical protein